MNLLYFYTRAKAILNFKFMSRMNGHTQHTKTKKQVYY